MKPSLIILLLLACWQVAAVAPPPAPPAVGPESAPEPQLLSLNFEEEYAQPTDYMDYSPEQYTSTRFQARFITLNHHNKNDDERGEQQPSEFSTGLGIQYCWTRHQWVRNLDNETRIDEEYTRQIVVGVPLLLIALSTLLSVMLLIIEIHERIASSTAADEDYYHYYSKTMEEY